MRIVLLNLFAGLLSAQTVSLLAPRTFTGTKLPNAILSGDFNNDGLLDVLVSADEYDFFAGNGNGTFLPPVNTPTGVFIQTVAADFNRDGKLDLASINPYDLTPSVSVSLGNGDGTFSPAVVYSIPSIATSIAAGDFNNDGIPDLAVSNGDVISVLLGRGDGTLAPPINTPANGSVLSIAAADLNGDGNLDLAAVDAENNGGDMQLLLGNGQGSFTLGSRAFLNTPSPRVVAVSDLRLDGVFDVLVVDTADVFVFLGYGDGTFQPAVTYPVADGESIAIADVNGDGKPDLLVGDYDSNAVSVLLGNGDGTFQPQAFASAGVSVVGVATGDFNGDASPILLRPTKGPSPSPFSLAINTPASMRRASPCHPPTRSSRPISTGIESWILRWPLAS